MIPEDAAAMIKHYFQCETLDTLQLERLQNAVASTQLTPAALEQLILEKDSVDEVIDAVVLLVGQNHAVGDLHEDEKKEE